MSVVVTNSNSLFSWIFGIHLKDLQSCTALGIKLATGHFKLQALLCWPVAQSNSFALYLYSVFLPPKQCSFSNATLCKFICNIYTFKPGNLVYFPKLTIFHRLKAEMHSPISSYVTWNALAGSLVNTHTHFQSSWKLMWTNWFSDSQMWNQQ